MNCSACRVGISAVSARAMHRRGSTDRGTSGSVVSRIAARLRSFAANTAVDATVAGTGGAADLTSRYIQNGGSQATPSSIPT